MALLGRSRGAVGRPLLCAYPHIFFIIGNFQKKVVFFYFVFVILARVHLAGASRCFLALLRRSREAPGRYVRRAPGRQNGLAPFPPIRILKVLKADGGVFAVKVLIVSATKAYRQLGGKIPSSWGGLPPDVYIRVEIPI